MPPSFDKAQPIHIEPNRRVKIGDLKSEMIKSHYVALCCVPGDWGFNVSVVIDFHSARTRAAVSGFQKSLALHEESGAPRAASSFKYT